MRIVLAVVSIISVFVSSYASDFVPYNESDLLYERVWFATDRDVYVAGDRIHVSLATVDGVYMSPIDYSCIAYIEVFTQDNIPVVQAKAELHASRGEVVLTVPKKLKTDFYFIRAYTNYQKNFGAVSFQTKRLRIINPFEIIPIRSVASEKMADTLPKAVSLVKANQDSIYLQVADTSLQSLAYNLSVNNFNVDQKKTATVKTGGSISIPLYGYKGTVQLHWSFGDSLTGSIPVSISVCDSVVPNDSITTIASKLCETKIGCVSGWCNDLQSFTDTKVLVETAISIPQKFEFPSELSEDVIFGSVARKDDQVLPEQVFVSAPNSNDLFIIAPVDSSGNFAVSVASLAGHDDLSVVPSDTSSMIQVFIANEFYPDFVDIEKQQYNPEKWLGSYVKDLMVQVQLKDAFSRATVKETENLGSHLFYGKYDETVTFDEYVNLPVFEDYIHELMPSVYVKKKKKSKYIRVSDYDYRGFVGKNPLLLVNGVPYLNHSLIVNIDPKIVEKVYVVNHKLNYLGHSFDGIFDIRLKEFEEENMAEVSNAVQFSIVSASSSVASINSTFPEEIEIPSIWIPKFDATVLQQLPKKENFHARIQMIE